MEMKNTFLEKLHAHSYGIKHGSSSRAMQADALILRTEAVTAARLNGSGRS